jgi:hypothetical protein
MDNQKIIQINMSELNHEKILPFVKSVWPQHNWENTKDCHKITDTSNIITGRFGTNVFPFGTDAIDSCNIKPPAYDGTFTKTFSDVTDEQCQQWLREKTDRPWLVLWSGGIDSTVIVASILKNTSPADRENIYIACNRASVYELPRFFYDHVQPNFKLIQTPDPGTQSLSELYHVIDGEFADHLYTGGFGWELLRLLPEYLTADFRRHPDVLLNHLASATNKNFAIWYYDLMLDNINSTNIPIETYHDFYWWHFFNYQYTDVYIRTRINTFANEYSPRWYATDDYQQWAMNNNQFGTKYTLDLSDSKLASKQYIYDFDHDEYCRTFKIKSKSIQMSVKFVNNNSLGVFCVLDDFSKLHLDRDLDRILELLPDHVVA